MLLDATQTDSEQLHEWAARALRALLANDDNRRAFGDARNGEGLFILTTLLGADNSALVEHVIRGLEALATLPDNRAKLANAVSARGEKSIAFI